MERQDEIRYESTCEQEKTNLIDWQTSEVLLDSRRIGEQMDGGTRERSDHILLTVLICNGYAVIA